jgi:hypothetical protein
MIRSMVIYGKVSFLVAAPAWRLQLSAFALAVVQRAKDERAVKLFSRKVTGTCLPMRGRN